MKTKLAQTVNCALRAAAIRPMALNALLLALLGSPGHAIAEGPTNAPPDLLSYQGYLVDANGNPLATNTPANYPVVFRIYSAANGGSKLWTEQQVVTVDRGNFSVVLGEGKQYLSESRPALSAVLANRADASDLYIGLNVTISGNDAEILPRLRLLPTPYAFLATSARNLTDPNGTNVLAYKNGRVEITGNLYASGTISGPGSDVALRTGGNAFTGNQTINDGNVGIGTTYPENILQVNRTFHPASGYGLAVSKSDFGANIQIERGAGQSGLGLVVDNSLAGDAGTSLLEVRNDVKSGNPKTLLKVQSDGNVGIGATTPAFPLTFADTLGDKISLWSQSGNHYGFGVGASTLQIHGGASTSDIALGYGRSGSFTETVRFKGNGNVGVGTSTPSARLHVVGDVQVDNNRGIALNAGDSALVTRGHNKFTSGKHNGLGRWGVFMEGGGVAGLVLGVPDNGLGVVSVAKYKEDSSYTTLLKVDNTGAVSARVFSPTSDRDLKENFARVDAMVVLEQVAQLPLTRWNFKSDPASQHLGPVAQDFHAAFGLGADDKHITTIDADGVALAAIQGLNEKVEEQEVRILEQESRIRDQAAEINDLRARLEALEHRLAN